VTPLDRIDSVINDAASRMTNAKPSDALRANVMSRISVERPSRFGWRYVFAGGAIASVALVAFAAWPHNAAVSQFAISTPTVINPTILTSPVNSPAATDPTAAANRPSPLTSVARTAAFSDARA